MKNEIDPQHFPMRLPDVHIAATDSPWIEYAPNIMIRYVAFDVRQGSWASIFKTNGPAALGRHRHRGPVQAFTIAGSWGYREYDWLARAGDFVSERPGAIHTLYTDDPEGMEVLFMPHGCSEYFDEEGNIKAYVDVFHHVEKYLNYCSVNAVEVDERLFV